VDTTAKLVTFGHQIDKTGTGLVELKTASANRLNALTPALDPFLGKEARMKARWSADDDFVFSARKGKPVDYRNLRRALDVAAEEPGACPTARPAALSYIDPAPTRRPRNHLALRRPTSP
jgi:hypothetical protein